MPERVLIADIPSLTQGGKPYGHFAKVGEQWAAILGEQFRVTLATGYGGPQDHQAFKLPHTTPLALARRGGLPAKLGLLVAQTHNAWTALRQPVQAVVCQCLGEAPLCLALLLTPLKGRRVYIIRYEPLDGGLLKRWLRALVAGKLAGVITSQPQVAASCGTRALLVPDYFPAPGETVTCPPDFAYDLAVLGTQSAWKTLEQVARVFSGTRYRVLMAGYFEDKDRLSRLQSRAGPNIRIIDRYLSQEAYRQAMALSRYVLLPYGPQYAHKGSGVVLEALYGLRPVVVPSLPSFRFVGDKGLGIVYGGDILAALQLGDTPDQYGSYCRQAQLFRQEMEGKKGALLSFIKSSR